MKELCTEPINIYLFLGSANRDYKLVWALHLKEVERTCQTQFPSLWSIQYSDYKAKNNSNNSKNNDFRAGPDYALYDQYLI